MIPLASLLAGALDRMPLPGLLHAFTLPLKAFPGSLQFDSLYVMCYQHDGQGSTARSHNKRKGKDVYSSGMLMEPNLRFQIKL